VTTLPTPQNGKHDFGAETRAYLAYVSGCREAGVQPADPPEWRSWQGYQPLGEGWVWPEDLPETPEEAPGPWPRLRVGDRFVLDEDGPDDAIWGSGAQVLWAPGEPLMIVGPTGVGKTTLANQLIYARLGLVAEVLGLPVVPADERPILILAMDRPKQARRALRRLFGEDDRQLLAERLVVHNGPLASDVSKHPEVLPELCEYVGCGMVVIDSVKDIASNITDGEMAAGVNRAMQMVCADGREVVALHHQRKGQGGAKPDTLEDVYGNMQLTAGSGSVLLLWGQAGDPLVELRHLKQPAEPVGPWMLEHDSVHGLFSVSRGFDMLVYLRYRRSAGATSTDAAKAMLLKDKPTDNERKKAQRVLDRLTEAGLARRVDGVGIGVPATYYAVEDLLI